MSQRLEHEAHPPLEDISFRLKGILYNEFRLNVRRALSGKGDLQFDLITGPSGLQSPELLFFLGGGIQCRMAK